MKLNGKEIKNRNAKTLQELLVLYNFDMKNIVALVNEEIVKREQWNDYRLSENDNIEIIGFVGGG